MLRYAAEDDFGLPETAFNFCTFWLIEALHLAGRERRGARALREDARAADPGGPAFRGHRLRHGRAVGQLSADLFACRTDQLRGAFVPTLEYGPMSRLIVISNRVSAPKPRSAEGAQGGLAVALAAALREYARHLVRLVGREDRRISPARSTSSATTASPPRRSTSKSRTSTNIITATPTARSGRSSTTASTWPNMTAASAPATSGSTSASPRRVAPLIEPDDLVWVHDYHLIPLGQQLRQRGVKNRIGFFLHIPWPPHRLMVSLPYHQRLVRSMLAYDLIGFQTEEWLESFHHYVERELGGTVAADGTIQRRRPRGAGPRPSRSASTSSEFENVHDRRRRPQRLRDAARAAPRARR